QSQPDDGGDSDGNDSGSTGVLAGSSGDFEGDGGLPFDARQAGSGTPSLYLENCFVMQQSNNTDAVSIDGGEALLLYSTLVGRVQEAQPSRALSCSGEALVSARNNLFLSTDS